MRHVRYVENDRVEIDLPNRCTITAIASDLSITPTLIVDRVYDWPFWRFLHRYLRRGDHAVDIGANIGLFTVAMAKKVGRRGRVTAFEPDPTLAGVVRTNLARNGLDGRCEVLQAAAASEAGELSFARHEKFWGSSAAGVADLSTHAVSGGYQWSTVPAVRPDELLTGRLRLVKIDVEGGEASVIDGLTGVLDRADLIDVEVVRRNTPDWMGLVTRLRRLAAAGGKPHLINWQGRLEPATLDHVIALGEFPHVVFRF